MIFSYDISERILAPHKKNHLDYPDRVFAALQKKKKLSKCV